MRCTAEKHPAIAAKVGIALIVQVKDNQPTLHHAIADYAAAAIRACWRIETTPHHSRDVTMGGVVRCCIRDRGWNSDGGEDRSRLRTDPGVAARLHRFACNILQAGRIGTLSQDRCRAALGGRGNLLNLLAVSWR